MDNKWQLEGLVKRAFERTKERFVSYFLTWLVSFGVSVVVILSFFVGIFILILIAGLTKSVIVTVLASLISGIAVTIALIYVFSWINLATVSVVISDKKLGAIETLKKVKPMVWGYFWLNFLTGLFMIGLLPYAFITLLIVPILWSLWASFVPFVYLRLQKKGLQNLWISRQMFRQRPWGIFGRMALVGLGVFAISFFLSFSMKNAAGAGLSTLFSIFAAPFLLSFAFEVYSNLKEPKEEVKASKVWFVLSLLGWILMILGTIAVVGFVIQNAMMLFNQYQANPQEFWKNIIPTPTSFPFESPML